MTVAQDAVLSTVDLFCIIRLLQLAAYAQNGKYEDIRLKVAGFRRGVGSAGYAYGDKAPYVP